MHEDTVIKVESLSKKYLISSGYQPDSLREKIAELIKYPVKFFHKISPPKTSNFWALKNISFEVKKGEILGIIGRNGAGKSTLLKILSRVTEPTSGHIEIKGKIASLLEVGTGFNPDLTGRENIYLNGAILGMNRQEIKRKFKEIVEFSGIGEFLDVPVKRYSSGMYVRLAFAVASQLESDILLLDEVLSVGDISFQKKSMKKMNEMIHSGKTIIFVSHNIAAVSSLCQRGIMIDKGQITFTGDIGSVIKAYYDANAEHEISKNNSNHEIIFKNHKNRVVSFLSFSLRDKNNNIFPGMIGENEEMVFTIKYSVNKLVTFPTHLTLTLENGEGVNVLFSRDIGRSHKARFIHKEKGIFETQIKLPKNILAANRYFVSLAVFQTGGSSEKIDSCQRIVSFDIVDKLNHIEASSSSILSLDLPWKTRKI